MLDAGLLRIYRADNVAVRGAAPTRRLTLKDTVWYGDRVVGATRYYAARQANAQIDRVARIWRDPTVSPLDVVAIGGEQYMIRQVQHVEDDDGLPVTDLSLERLVDVYDLG